MKITIEDITDVTIDRVKRMHEKSGFDYRFPDLNTPRFPVQIVGLAEGHRTFIAAALKVEAEAYLWLDGEYGTPEERWEGVRAINAKLITRARIIGFDQLYCVLPPEVAKSFGPRLEQLSWVKARPWPKYTLELSKPELV